jgi:hypothetical protein
MRNHTAATVGVVARRTSSSPALDPLDAGAEIDANDGRTRSTALRLVCTAFAVCRFIMPGKSPTIISDAERRASLPRRRSIAALK